MFLANSETTPSVQTLNLNGSNPDLLPKFVETAHENVSFQVAQTWFKENAPECVAPQGVKAFVSIGGWTGSQYFSTNVGSAENRTAFVKTVTDFAWKYDLDGLDFEYVPPNNIAYIQPVLIYFFPAGNIQQNKA